MCEHYWVLESQHGKTSLGVCKYCGERREFLNAFPDTPGVRVQSYQNMGMCKRMFIPDNNIDGILINTKSRLRTQRLLIDSI